MTQKKSIDMWYSLQSDYCYFLIDRLLKLQDDSVDITLRPVLGIILRMPERTADRDMMEQEYFLADTERTAEFLDIPYAIPDPSPIALKPGSVWIAAEDQPRIPRLFQLFVGANNAGKGLPFLEVIARGLWNGQNPGWDKSSFLRDGMAAIGLDHDEVIEANPWDTTQEVLHANHLAMLDAGHWGVPLMTYEGEAFYGQDRFDQLLWRMAV